MQVKFNNVYYTYGYNSPFAVPALKHINITLFDGNISAIVGRTGSGKSTLIELINKLLTPISGEVIVDNLINSKKVKIKGRLINEYRKKIGFLFQQSENQLFEDTVLKDVMFGIKSFYPKDKNFELEAKQALKLVGLDESFYSSSPFDLSGGEKKRVALACVLAYKPQLLILDEPTAGLDAKSKAELLSLLKSIHASKVDIILVTHDMDVILDLADKVYVIEEGVIKKEGAPLEIFKEDVEQYNLQTPNLFKFTHLLKRNGLDINENKVIDIPSLIKEIKRHG